MYRTAVFVLACLSASAAFAAPAASAVSAASAAAPAANPLSVHVLDLQSGKPTAGIAVTLEARAGDGWRELAAATTDAQGRVKALFPAGQAMAAGDYRIVFGTGEYYRQHGQPTFFPRIPVEIHVDDPAQHTHVPLLLSPFGYSTYRGN